MEGAAYLLVLCKDISFLRGEAVVIEENGPVLLPNYQSAMAQSAVHLKGREWGDLIGYI